MADTGGTGDDAVGGRIRLYHRRRRHRRLRARQPALRRPEQSRAAAGSRRQGRLSLDPHPRRLSVLHRQSAHRLVLQDRARARPERPRAELSARQGAGRLLVDQRHDLHARPGARTTTSGRQLGNAGLGAGTTCCRYFKRSEDHWRGAAEFHGAGGEWRVEAPRLSWEILDAFRDAAEQCGIPKIDDFNRGDNKGCGYFDVNQKRGIRWNAAKAFLRPATRPRPICVLTGAQASALRFDGTALHRRRVPSRRPGAVRRRRAPR